MYRYAYLANSVVDRALSEQAQRIVTAGARSLGMPAPCIRWFKGVGSSRSAADFTASGWLLGQASDGNNVALNIAQPREKLFDTVNHELRHCAQQRAGFSGDREQDADAWAARECRKAGHCRWGRTITAEPASLALASTGPIGSRATAGGRQVATVRHPFTGAAVRADWARDYARHERDVAALRRARGVDASEFDRRAASWDSALRSVGTAQG